MTQQDVIFVKYKNTDVTVIRAHIAAIIKVSEGRSNLLMVNGRDLIIDHSYDSIHHLLGLEIPEPPPDSTSKDVGRGVPTSE